MRISYRKISWIFAAIIVAASVLYSCEPVPPVDRPDQEQETPGGNEGNGNEDTPGGGDNPGGEENETAHCGCEINLRQSLFL